MNENLVGYALNALDENTERQVEAYLAEHPEARQTLARVRQALAPLAADAAPPEPPRDLFARTVALVAEHICKHEPKPTTADQPLAELPKAPPVHSDSATGGRGWWRRADVLIAACLLVTMLGVLLPALSHLRSASGEAAMTACANNLRQFYTALQTYHDQHGAYPNVAAEAPRDVAGMVVPILADAGTLPTDASIRCPGNGPHLACNVTLASLRTMPPDEFQAKAPSLSHCYAYSLGHRDAQGTYYTPGSTARRPDSLNPLMADRPPSEGAVANSMNHGGTGQNVLYLDGHVRYLTARHVSGDDFFLNLDNEVAAGRGPTDAVLGYSAARP